MNPDALARRHAAGFETPPPWSAASFAQLLADKTVFALGDEIGFAFGRMAADEAELLTLLIAPEVRRTGRARELMTQFDDTARAKGATRAYLEVAETNAPALALYTSCGWSHAARRPRYYKTPDGLFLDALILTKPLV